MMKNTKKIILWIFFNIGTSFWIIVFAQDIHFSQFRETPMLINPAQTCLNKDIRVILNYKEQWKSVASPYKTFAFSGEYSFRHNKVKKKYLNIGVQLFNDKAGDSQMGTMQGLLALSAVVKITELQKLSVGIIGGWAQRSINYNALRWDNQYDGNNYNPAISPTEPLVNTPYSYADIGAGILWNYGKEQKYISANNGMKANIGVSAFHFGLPNYSYYKNTNEKLLTKIIGHANVEIGIERSNLIVIPEIIYARQGHLSELNAGVMFKYLLKEQSIYTKNIKASSFALGMHNRVRDALIFTVLYEYANYSIGMSYDVNISRLSLASNLRGGFEISLRFVTPNPHSYKTKAQF